MITSEQSAPLFHWNGGPGVIPGPTVKSGWEKEKLRQATFVLFSLFSCELSHKLDGFFDNVEVLVLTA